MAAAERTGTGRPGIMMKSKSESRVGSHNLNLKRRCVVEAAEAGPDSPNCRNSVPMDLSSESRTAAGDSDSDGGEPESSEVNRSPA